MTQKAVLITGGARRIGAALARIFAADGYDIALHYNHSADEAAALMLEMGAKLYQADLTAPDATKNLIQAVKADFPHLNTLINNASTFRRAHLQESTEASIHEDIAINLSAPLNLMREFTAHTEQGSIINMLDIAIHDTHPAHFAYLIAKKGLAEATKMAAREYDGEIRVNGICPGHVLPTENTNAHEPTVIAENPPTVQQVVETALLLANDRAYNGELLNIDGSELS
ncbi:MAG: SDR family NAD(P)-dependent oxidoreductase [Rickettsiales bacterium]|nr:SDR family NAD(P)-dependent oxidoreductase [Rickettsiales bacterium]